MHASTRRRQFQVVHVEERDAWEADPERAEHVRSKHRNEDHHLFTDSDTKLNLETLVRWRGYQQISATPDRIAAPR